MKFSICIPTYQRNRELALLLNNLLEQAGFSQCVKEIIIGDNNPNNKLDGKLMSIIKTNKCIKYFRNPTNVGFEKNLKRS